MADGQSMQHVARSGAQRDRREAAHDARHRAREPCLLALGARHAVVLVGHALGDVDKLQDVIVA